MKMPEELGDCPLTYVMYERIVRHCAKLCTIDRSGPDCAIAILAAFDLGEKK